MRIADCRSDQELVLTLRSDPAALEELFRRHRRALLAYGMRRCANAADAADLLAATFLAALESAPGYDPSRGEVLPWLFGIAFRQLGLMRRRESRARSEGMAVVRSVALSDDAIVRIEEQMDAARASVEVRRALIGLPERHREVLWLVSEDHLSRQEAAQVLGVSPGTFRVRLARARRALRAALGDRVSHLTAVSQETY